MRRLYKFSLIGILLLVLAVAALLAGGSFYLQSDHARQVLQGLIDRAIPGAVTWEDLRLSLSKGTVTLDRVRLRGPEGEEIVFVDRLVLEVSWLPLVRREAAIERVIIQAPNLHLRVDGSGSMNLLRALSGDDQPVADPAGPPASPRGQPPVNIIIRSLLLQDGKLQLVLEKDGIDLGLAGIDLAGSANIGEKAGHLSLKASRLAFSRDDVSTVFNQVFFETGLRDGRIAPLELRIGNPTAHVRLGGTVEGIWDRPAIDVAADMAVPLALLKELLGVQHELTGMISSRIRLRGSIDAPQAQASLDYGGGRILDHAVDGAELHLDYTDGALVVDRTHVRLAGGQVGLEGRLGLGKSLAHIIDTGDMGLASATYQLRLAADGIHLQQLFEPNGQWRGPVGAVISIEGQGFSPDTATANLVAEMTAAGLTAQGIGGPVNLTVSASAAVEAGVGHLRALEATAGPVNLSADGHFDFSNKAIDARLSLNVEDLEKLAASTQVPGIEGRLHLEGTAAGTLEAPVFHVDLDGQRFRFRDMTLGDINLAAELDRSGVLRIPRLDLKNQASAIHGKGAVHLFAASADSKPGKPMDFVLELNKLNLTDFISSSPVEGRFDGKLTLSGTLTAPEASLALDAKGVSMQGHRLGDIAADLKFGQGILNIAGVSLVNRQSTLDLSGTAALLDPGDLTPLKDPRFDIVFGSAGIHLKDITPDYSGTVTTRGNLRGSLSHPLGEIELSGQGIDLGVQKFENAALSVNMDGDRFHIQQLKVVLQDDEVVTGTGWVGTDGEFSLDLSSDGISLEKLAKGQLREAASGKLRFDLSGGGTLDQPRLKGTVSTSGLHLNGKAVGDADLSVNLADDRLRVNGRLNFDIDGTLDLAKKDFNLAARFDDTDLMPYLKAAGLADLSGALTGSLRAQGNLDDAENIRADADIEKLNLALRQLSVLTGADFRFTLEGKTLTLPKAHLVLPGKGHIDLSGSGRLDGPLDFTLDGAVPMSAVSLLTEEVSAPSGHVTVKGHLKGTTQAPDFTADLRVENGGLTILALEQNIRNIQGKINVTTAEIVVEALTGQVDNGRFSVSGRLGLDRFQPTGGNLILDANAIPVDVPDTMDLLVSSRIEVSGTPQALLAKGEFVLLEGTYYRDVNLSLVEGIQRLSTRQRDVKVKAESALSPFLENVRLNISVGRRNPLIVDNNLADMEVHPDLRLTGTLKDPVLTGRADIKAGTVTYINSVFDIQKGVIDFNNPYRIEPEFDIEGQIQVRDWLITMTITGTPEALDLELASDPPLGDGDIASLLVFGRTSQEISGGGQAGAGQSSSHMLAELLAANYGGDIKRATGLDVFEVQAGKDSSTDEEHITVTVGKELSERVTLKYAAESRNGEFIQRAIAEYKILEHLLLSGFQDTSGSFGGAVKYRLEFR